MKKGIILFAMVVFLVFSFSQAVLANITLNVNAKSASTANKLYYMTGDTLTTLKTVSLPWKEKAVYGFMGESMVTVTTKAKGYIIAKIDMIPTTGGAITTGKSYIFKYATDGYFNKYMSLKTLDNEITGLGDWTDITKYTIDATATEYPMNTTITLLDFTDDWTYTGYIVITVLLIDDVTDEKPQVIGVDTQTLFFNNIGETTTDITSTNSPGQWLYIISNGKIPLPPN